MQPKKSIPADCGSRCGHLNLVCFIMVVEIPTEPI